MSVSQPSDTTGQQQHHAAMRMSGNEPQQQTNSNINDPTTSLFHQQQQQQQQHAQQQAAYPPLTAMYAAAHAASTASPYSQHQQQQQQLQQQQQQQQQLQQQQAAAAAASPYDAWPNMQTPNPGAYHGGAFAPHRFYGHAGGGLGGGMGGSGGGVGNPHTPLQADFSSYYPFNYPTPQQQQQQQQFYLQQQQQQQQQLYQQHAAFMHHQSLQQQYNSLNAAVAASSLAHPSLWNLPPNTASANGFSAVAPVSSSTSLPQPPSFPPIVTSSVGSNVSSVLPSAQTACPTLPAAPSLDSISAAAVVTGDSTPQSSTSTASPSVTMTRLSSLGTPGASPASISTPLSASSNSTLSSSSQPSPQSVSTLISMATSTPTASASASAASAPTVPASSPPPSAPSSSAAPSSYIHHSQVRDSNDEDEGGGAISSDDDGDSSHTPSIVEGLRKRPRRAHMMTDRQRRAKIKNGMEALKGLLAQQGTFVTDQVSIMISSVALVRKLLGELKDMHVIYDLVLSEFESLRNLLQFSHPVISQMLHQRIQQLHANRQFMTSWQNGGGVGNATMSDLQQPIPRVQSAGNPPHHRHHASQDSTQSNSARGSSISTPGTVHRSLGSPHGRGTVGGGGPLRSPSPFTFPSTPITTLPFHPPATGSFANFMHQNMFAHQPPLPPMPMQQQQQQQLDAVMMNSSSGPMQMPQSMTNASTLDTSIIKSTSAPEIPIKMESQSS